MPRFSPLAQWRFVRSDKGVLMKYAAVPLTSLAICWLFLLSLPLALFSLSEPLFPWLNLDSAAAQFWYWLTVSGSAPWGVSTVLLVFAISFFILPRGSWLKMMFCTSLGLVLCLLLNEQLKLVFAESRPYIEWLSHQQHLDIKEFYSIDKYARRELLAQVLPGVSPLDMPISAQIQRHWQIETGFSFPSGHTIFAVTLTMCSSFFLLRHNNLWLPALLICWALLMGLSRMLLGMHWSVDVLTSTLLGGAAVGLGYLCRQPQLSPPGTLVHRGCE